MLQSINLVKLSVKDFVVPLWKGAKGKFGGAMPPFPPQKRLCFPGMITSVMMS